MPDYTTTDKLELGRYLQLLAGAVLQACAAVEASHPQWQVGTVDLTVRGVVKPAVDKADRTGAVVVVLDLDEPVGEPVTEIPLTIRRLG